MDFKNAILITKGEDFTFAIISWGDVVLSRTVVHSGHLFSKPSHNTTVLKCCLVTRFGENVAVVYHGTPVSPPPHARYMAAHR